MPTSTATLTATASMAKSPVSFKATTSSKSTLATLRSLYPRAARAFLQRNVELTYSLLLSAFSNLDAPYSPSPDPLSSHRRKWDMLRITLETTLYTSAPHTKEIPEALRSSLALSPPSLLATMHARSLQLFTPASRGEPSSEYLPSQILAALVLASVKLECVQVGREMVEDWLSRRTQTQHNPEADAKEAAEGYEKVLEIYCLHILPRLEDWEYAKEFLHFEDELAEDRKTYLVQSLNVLQAQHIENLEKMRENQRPSILLPSPSSSRTPTPRPLINGRQPSPSPSSTSASSNSTRTVVPHTYRPPRVPSSLSSLTPPPSTPPPSQKHLSPSTPIAQRTSSPSSPYPRHISSPQMPVSSVQAPSLLTLLKSSIIPHLTTSNLTFLFLMFLVPLVSFVLRLRRRRLRLWSNGGSTLSAARPGESAAAEARKRLRAGWWAGIRKAVADTVRMAGGGIV